MSADVLLEKEGEIGILKINRRKASQLSHGVFEG